MRQTYRLAPPSMTRSGFPGGSILRRACQQVFCVAVLLTMPAIASAQTQLTLKFKEGESFGQQVTTRTISGGEVAGKPMKTTLEQNMFITTQVLGVTPAGAGQLSQTIDQITLDIELPNGKTVAYDSRQKEFKDPTLVALNQTMGKLAGSKFLFTTTPNGEILDFQLPESIKELAKGPAAAVAGDALTEAGLRRMFEDAGVALPKEPVKKGDTWERKTSVKLPIGTVESQLIFTYDGPQNATLERIVVGGKVEIKPTEGTPIAVKLNTSSLEGLTLFNRELGRVESSTLSQKLEVNVSAGGQSNDMIIETQVETKTVPPKSTETKE